jgi:hypothetical protein
MVTPIENDIRSHLGAAPALTDSGSGSQDTFQSRVGRDISGDAPVITGITTRGPSGTTPLPEWAGYAANVNHILTIQAYNFTSNPGSITWLDTSPPSAGTSGVGFYSTGVYSFWNNVTPDDIQIF